jgi:hypothetical protein
LNIEWLLLAEDIAQDLRGTITAVGLNQNVFPAPSLPAVTKRAAVAHIVEAAGILNSSDKFTVMFKIIDPRGRIVSSQSGEISVGQLQWPSLPVSFDLPVQLVLNVSEYGTYRIEATAQPTDGPEVSNHVEFYVMEAPSAGASEPITTAASSAPPTFG